MKTNIFLLTLFFTGILFAFTYDHAFGMDRECTYNEDCVPMPTIVYPIPTDTVVSCTVTPEVSISPSEVLSVTPSDTISPTSEVQISPTRVNNAGQSATEAQPTPTPYYVGPTLMPNTGWK